MKNLLLLVLLSTSTSAMEHNHRPKDIRIHITEKELSSSHDSTDSNSGHSNKKLAIISAITGMTTAAITAAVTLAIHFSSCKCGVPLGNYTS